MGNMVTYANQINVGDFVKYDFDSLITGPYVGEYIDAACGEACYIGDGYKYFKGTVVNIRYRTWYGKKLNKPLYSVNMHMYPDVVVRTEDVKKIIR